MTKEDRVEAVKRHLKEGDLVSHTVCMVDLESVSGLCFWRMGQWVGKAACMNQSIWENRSLRFSWNQDVVSYWSISGFGYLNSFCLPFKRPFKGKGLFGGCRSV